jgi:hypothetical protein
VQALTHFGRHHRRGLDSISRPQPKPQPGAQRRSSITSKRSEFLGPTRGHYRDDRVTRDLTRIEAEAIEALAREHGVELRPGETRRNLTTRGIDLNGLIGRRF